MSEENFLSDISKSIKVPADITKATLEPPASQIGEGLGDLFYLVFSPLAKARIKKEHEIKLFRNEIESEISEIPAENLTEPPLNIVGPALEASRYYIENPDIRSMFSKLIASSVNSTKSEKTHSSFVEIIKQLSPLDAGNFKYLADNQIIGVGKIKTKNSNEEQGENTLIEHFFPFPKQTLENTPLYTASIENLLRLGLITIDHSLHFVHKERYDDLRSHPVFLHYQSQVNINNTRNPESSKELFLKESIWSVSDFGKQFSHCCL